MPMFDDLSERIERRRRLQPPPPPPGMAVIGRNTAAAIADWLLGGGSAALWDPEGARWIQFRLDKSSGTISCHFDDGSLVVADWVEKKKLELTRNVEARRSVLEEEHRRHEEALQAGQEKLKEMY